MNRLASEKSPYLLQHAANPVNWYPWSDEAFKKARAEDKPVFLSIGYSTCHWCHVMAHESFEDPDVAELMNKAFVNIKVDREERPDLDSLYMTVCSLLTGNGGWPLTVIMTPDRKPFFSGTYFPSHSLPGRIGMTDLIPRIVEIWKNRRQEVLDSTDSILATLEKISAPPESGEYISMELIDKAHENLKSRFDATYGGFGTAPKFPTPHNLTFLLRYGALRQNGDAVHMATVTLDAMSRGGIYDRIGHGFHRYATDRKWLLPHFEKMLSDQALIAMAYLEAWSATGNSRYKEIVEEIFAYVLERMTSPEGSFYTAEDADSEGEEGKYYLWTMEELHALLADDERELARRIYSVSEEGNFADEASGNKNGANILFLEKSLAENAANLGIPERHLQDTLRIIRDKLLAARLTRKPPHKDDKILTDINGLMIQALAMGARVLDRPRYLEAARRAADFLLAVMQDGQGRLLHRFRDKEAGITGMLEDYVFFTRGLLELYQADFSVRYLWQALRLTELLLAEFHDEKNGGFFQASVFGEKLLIRQKQVYDGAIPSANSIAIENLRLLSRLTGRGEFEEIALRSEQAFSRDIREQPDAYTKFLSRAAVFGKDPCEVVVVGPSGARETEALLNALKKKNSPDLVVLFKDTRSDPDLLATLAPFTRGYIMQDDIAAAYVCRNHTCNSPVTGVAEMIRLLP